MKKAILLIIFFMTISHVSATLTPTKLATTTPILITQINKTANMTLQQPVQNTTQTVNNIRLLSNVSLDIDSETEILTGTKYDTGTQQKNTAFKRQDYYDSKNRLIAYTENQSDHYITYVMQYDSYGKVSKEIIIDHETGQISDEDALMQELGNLEGFQSLYQAMYALLQQSFEEKKQAREEAQQAAEQEVLVAQNASAQKQDEIEQAKDDAQDNFFTSIKNLFVTEPKAKMWMNSEAQNLSDKLPGMMNDTAEKGEEFGEQKPNIFQRLFGWMFQKKDTQNRDIQTQND